VLDALLSALRDCGASLEVSRRVERVERVERGFMVTTRDSATYEAPLVVLATGGRSLPKTGSDGAGYAFARALGHGCVETTPALVPLLLADSRYATLTGVTHNVGVTVTTDGGSVRLDGAMLWTHFGLSGPVILNASRHWLRARVEGRAAAVLLHVLPRTTFAELEHWLQTQQRQHPRALVRTVVASRLPASVADAWVEAAGIDRAMTLAHLARDARRTLIATLLETPLDVTDSRGYNYAEVTAGGIPLGEIDSATMESRLCPGLYLIGEILDVDGRIGGFNFQWAWSSAWVAANAIGRKLRA
jgi:predicted Rossmann fold flavoprotein